MLAAGVGKLLNFLTDPKVGRAVLGGGMEAMGPMRKVPGVRSMVPITPTSPLDLFDFDQFSKLSRETPGNKYFGGRSIHIEPPAVRGERPTMSFTDPDVALGRKRMAGAGALAGLLGASALGIDPFGAVSTTMSVGAFGAHAFVGGAMYKAGGIGKVLGLGYLGLLGYNTLQPGNQTGPM